MNFGQLTLHSLHDGIDHRSPPQTKIVLFRNLFRGREDVYPRRFESRKTGRTGYQPVCANEWVQGTCEKPRIKCSDCPHQRFLAVTDEAVLWHLSGHDKEGKDFVMGIYPMLHDETCFLLAVDFDKEGWREDANAFWETCRYLNVPAEGASIPLLRTLYCLYLFTCKTVKIVNQAVNLAIVGCDLALERISLLWSIGSGQSLLQF